MPIWQDATVNTSTGVIDLDSGPDSVRVLAPQFVLASNEARVGFGVQIAMDGSGVDPLAPGALVSIDLQAGSDSGSSNSDNITNVTEPVFDIVLPSGLGAPLDPEDGDNVVLEAIGDGGQTEALDAGEISGGTVALTMPTMSDGVYPTRARLERGVHLGPWLAGPTITIDTAAPTITSANTGNNTEGVVLAHALTANKSVVWTLTGGADQAQFEISGSTLRWASNGVQDFEDPQDAGTNNGYVAQVTATDVAGNATNQTITITVVNDPADDAAVPVNTVAPVISGNVQFGQTLSTTDGTWTNTPTGFTYQWKRAGVNIASATANTYVLVELDAGDDITCEVTASNGAGAGTPATSNTLAIDVYVVLTAHIEDATDLTTYSAGVWDAVATGVAAANRRIVLVIQSRHSGTLKTVSSCSVGGQACALTKAQASTLNGNEIWIVALPTGTTANLSITWSAATVRCSAGVYALYGAGSATATDTDGTAVDDTNVTITTPAGGAVIAGSYTTSGTVVWTGITKNQDITLETQPGSLASLMSPAGGDIVMKATWTGEGTAPSSVYASWGP